MLFSWTPSLPLINEDETKSAKSNQLQLHLIVMHVLVMLLNFPIDFPFLPFHGLIL